jgi:hypothetical protein
MAQDFNKDAEYLKALMTARANRLKVIMIAVGVGGAGTIAVPFIMM